MSDTRKLFENQHIILLSSTSRTPHYPKTWLHHHYCTPTILRGPVLLLGSILLNIWLTTHWLVWQLCWASASSSSSLSCLPPKLSGNGVKLPSPMLAWPSLLGTFLGGFIGPIHQGRTAQMIRVIGNISTSYGLFSFGFWVGYSGWHIDWV